MSLEQIMLTNIFKTIDFKKIFCIYIIYRMFIYIYINGVYYKRFLFVHDF